MATSSILLLLTTRYSLTYTVLVVPIRKQVRTKIQTFRSNDAPTVYVVLPVHPHHHYSHPPQYHDHYVQEVVSCGFQEDIHIDTAINCPDEVFTRGGGYIFLRLAIEVGRSQSLAKYLVEEKVMLQARDGFSALHLAIVQGWDSFVEYLIDKVRTSSVRAAKERKA
jgi:hypothetical protein